MALCASCSVVKVLTGKSTPVKAITLSAEILFESLFLNLFRVKSNACTFHIGSFIINFGAANSLMIVLFKIVSLTNGIWLVHLGFLEVILLRLLNWEDMMQMVLKSFRCRIPVERELTVPCNNSSSNIVS
jgi:hypothetical protein